MSGENMGNDQPFSAFITNLGKYNEGELVGKWHPFPTTSEDIQQTFKEIGIDGERYEEFFITDYDCNVSGIYEALPEYANLDELNFLATRLTEIEDYELEAFQSIVESEGGFTSVQDLINLTYNLDCYDHIPGVEDDEDLGYYWLEESGCYDKEAMGNLANYIDYESFGRDIRLDEGGSFSNVGYVRSNGDSFVDQYDGMDVPEDYRVTSTMDISEQAASATPDDYLTGEKVITPRGAFSLTTMNHEQIETAGYGFHHESDDGKFHIMANGTQAFAVRSEDDQPTVDASGKLDVLLVEPGKVPRPVQIDPGLEPLQQAVGGMIEAVYPYDDMVALICNEDGKLEGLPLNRALHEENGDVYDMIAGNFLVAGLTDDGFGSLPPKLMEKFSQQFHHPEEFVKLGSKILAVKMPVEEPGKKPLEPER